MNEMEQGHKRDFSNLYLLFNSVVIVITSTSFSIRLPGFKFCSTISELCDLEKVTFPLEASVSSLVNGSTNWVIIRINLDPRRNKAHGRVLNKYRLLLDSTA